MNRTLVAVLVLAVLCSGAVATAAAFTDGDEVVDGSEVYLDAADSDNGERYVQIDESDEVRLRFDALPPGSQTRVDDLFVVGFAGYEDNDTATTVRLESTDDRVAVERMDTGESFGNGTVELQPGESVLFGAVVSTDSQGFSSTIELEVDVPDDSGDTGGEADGGDEDNAGGAGGGGTGGASDEDGTSEAENGESDESDNTDDDTPGETTAGGDGSEGAQDGEEDGAADGDGTGPSADGIGGDLIELAGFGTPPSLVGAGILAALLSLSYAYRIQAITGGLVSTIWGRK